MIGRDRIAGSVLLGLALGITTLAFSQQQPTDGQQPAAQQDTPATPPAPDPELANQVQQLQAEVEQLKAQIAQLNSVVEQLQNERTTTSPSPSPANEKVAVKKSAKTGTASNGKKMAANPAPAAPPAVAEETAPTTVLVFHDGHRTEARNYAIVGQTLWIYTADESQKVPLSDLDVAATKNANSDRDIIFQMPSNR